MIETQTSVRILLLSLITTSCVWGQGSELLTGKKLQREINRPGTIYWSSSPLRNAVSSITTNRLVPIWLDRRCDPGQSVTLISQAPLADSLWELSESNKQLDVAWTEDLVYVGPANAANQWATVNAMHRSMLKKLPRKHRERWLSKRAWSWNRLTNPQDLLKQLETELGQPIERGKHVLHDLWPAQELPTLPLFVRLELLLSGYGYTFSFGTDGNAIVRSMPTQPRFSQPLAASPKHQTALAKLTANDSNAKLSEDGRRLSANWRTHEAYRRAIAPPRPTPKRPPSNVLYTLRAKDQPLGTFLQQLSKQLQLQCKFSDEAQVKATQMISFEVEKVDLQGLLKAIIAPKTGLKFRLHEDKLFIEAESVTGT